MIELVDCEDERAGAGLMFVGGARHSAIIEYSNLKNNMKSINLYLNYVLLQYNKSDDIHDRVEIMCVSYITCWTKHNTHVNNYCLKS